MLCKEFCSTVMQNLDFGWMNLLSKKLMISTEEFLVILIVECWETAMRNTSQNKKWLVFIEPVEMNIQKRRELNWQTNINIYIYIYNETKRSIDGCHVQSINGCPSGMDSIFEIKTIENYDYFKKYVREYLLRPKGLMILWVGSFVIWFTFIELWT